MKHCTQNYSSNSPILLVGMTSELLEDFQFAFLYYVQLTTCQFVNASWRLHNISFHSCYMNTMISISWWHSLLWCALVSLASNMLIASAVDLLSENYMLFIVWRLLQRDTLGQICQSEKHLVCGQRPDQRTGLTNSELILSVYCHQQFSNVNL